MKRLIKYISVFLLSAFIFISACKDEFLDRTPFGTLNESVLGNLDGLNGLLIAAYAELDGWAGWTAGAVWDATGTNWLMADVTADDAYKGTDAGDQPLMNPVERNEHDPSNRIVNSNWNAFYDGIARSNDVIKILAQAEGIDGAQAAQFQAEARFLRAHYHFQLVRIFGPNIPWVDESAPLDGLVANDREIWSNIEGDFEFAMGTLPETQNEKGRATSFAAKAYLGRVMLYQGKFSNALPLFNDVINSGQFSMLTNFADVHGTVGNNGPHSIFQIQSSVNDGVPDGENGNYGEVLNNPHNGAAAGGCCGFFQPTHNLVNAFKTENGLPIANFNETDLGHDQGCFSNSPDCCTEDANGACTVPYEVDPHPVDPRLDHTVGRKGIPYLDWGIHPGIGYIRDQVYGGPFSPKKRIFKLGESGTNSISGHSWGANGATAINYNIIRYADVLLMAAECEIEANNLARGQELINLVRSRIKDNPDNWVKLPDGSDAANYEIELYDAFGSQEEAREALQFERRLEFAMEGHRMFDLNRWGISAQVMNDYYQKESAKRAYLIGAKFDAHRVLNPIPQNAIDRSVGTLQQNPGY